MGTDRSFETTVELDGDDVEVVVEYSYSPGSPGKTYGPPEDCYPPEGPEVDVVAVYRADDKTKTDLSSKLSKKDTERLTERACEDGDEGMRDDYEAAMEDRADAAREREWDD